MSMVDGSSRGQLQEQQHGPAVSGDSYYAVPGLYGTHLHLNPGDR